MVIMHDDNGDNDDNDDEDDNDHHYMMIIYSVRVD